MLQCGTRRTKVAHLHRRIRPAREPFALVAAASVIFVARLAALLLDNQRRRSDMVGDRAACRLAIASLMSCRAACLAASAVPLIDGMLISNISYRRNQSVRATAKDGMPQQVNPSDDRNRLIHVAAR